MSEKSRLIKNTGLIAMGNLGAKVVSFLLMPLYTSLLATSEYGIYDYIIAVSAFLVPVVTLSMTEAMFRFIIDTGNEGEGFKKVVTNAVLVIFCGIAAFGVFFSLVWVLFRSENLGYIFIYVIANSFYLFSNNLLRGMGKIKEYAIVSSGKNILMVLLNIFTVVILHCGLRGLLFSMCFSEVIAFLIVFVFSKLWTRIDLKLISFTQIKEMLVYALPLIPNTLGATVINLSDRLIVKNVIGADANGIYSISYKFPNIIETIYHYFYTAWSENASRVWSKDKAAAKKYYHSIHTQLNDIVFSAVLLMVAGMPVIFRIFVRGDYVEGFNYIPLLMFAMYFDCMAKYYSGIYTALKKTRVIAVSTVIAALVNIIINLILIRSIGLYAAAGSTLIADIVLLVVRKCLIYKEIKFKFDAGRVSIQILLTAFIVLLYDYNSWTKTGIAITAAVIYAAIANKSLMSAIWLQLKNKIVHK